ILPEWTTKGRFGSRMRHPYAQLRIRARFSRPSGPARERADGAELRPQLEDHPVASLVLPGRYRVSRRRDRGVDRCVMEDVMAEKPMPKPVPQWPDVTKPDTRGGGGPPETKRRR